MELKITKERVLEAAAKCSTSKNTLETLFPEAFEIDKKKHISFHEAHNEMNVLSYKVFGDNTLQVGAGSCPAFLYERCIAVNNDTNVELVQGYNKVLIVFSKK